MPVSATTPHEAKMYRGAVTFRCFGNAHRRCQWASASAEYTDCDESMTEGPPWVATSPTKIAVPAIQPNHIWLAAAVRSATEGSEGAIPKGVQWRDPASPSEMQLSRQSRFRRSTPWADDGELFERGESTRRELRQAMARLPVQPRAARRRLARTTWAAPQGNCCDSM